MKGLIERSDTGAIFLSIKHSSICEESKTERPGFKPIQVTHPRTGTVSTKYIKRYKGVEAYVNKLEWRDVTFDDQRYTSWKLHLDAAGTPCVLEFPFESRISSRFMKLAENIDFSKPVEFSAWKGEDEKTAFSVKQDGQNIPQRYTRDNPGECPPPVQNRAGKWSYDAQTDYLYDRMMNVVIPAVDVAAAIREESTPPHENGDKPDFDASAPEFIDDDEPPF